MSEGTEGLDHGRTKGGGGGKGRTWGYHTWKGGVLAPFPAHLAGEVIISSEV